MAGERADARRNYDHILAIARREVAEHGADVSLERIARTAGVGSATVRRHFPGRRAVLEAVYRERARELCDHAAEFAREEDPRAALLAWLDALVDFMPSARGLAVLLADGAGAHDEEESCAAGLSAAGEPLVRRAAQAGVVAPGVTAADLLALVVGVVLATERHAEAQSEAARLLGLAVRGVCPDVRV